MRHVQFEDLQDAMDDMLFAPDELFISSNSRHCALFSSAKGVFYFLEGDFSGSPAECEAEVRRIMSSTKTNNVRVGF